MADQPDPSDNHTMTARLSAVQSECIAISVLIDRSYGADSPSARQADRVLKALGHLRATLQSQASLAATESGETP